MLKQDFSRMENFKSNNDWQYYKELQDKKQKTQKNPESDELLPNFTCHCP